MKTDYEISPKAQAFDLLEAIEYAKTQKEAPRLSNKALRICPDFLDAILFQIRMEENSLKRDKLLNDSIEKEKNKLIKEGYFEKDYIGIFYGDFETRPYIRALYLKASYLANDGKIKQALSVCDEILRLNENDNTGTRFLKMALLACLEEESEMLKFYKKYPEESLEMLFPLFALYYKTGNDKKAKSYLNKINKANKYFIKYFNDTLEQAYDAPKGYYSLGKPSEIFMYFNNYEFLINTIPSIDYYILKYSKIS